MAIKFQDIVLAFDSVSSGQMYEQQAFLNKETGEIYWYSEFGDDLEDLPADIDNEKHVEIPHKNELGLGKSLALNFAYRYLPDEADEISAIFRRKGAYSNFKAILDEKGMLEKWYEFELQAEDEALREWCEENEIEINE